MSQSDMNTTDLIAEEQKLLAVKYQTEVWTDGILNGIEPEILAVAAFDTALQYLLQIRSEQQVLKLLSHTRDKVIMGIFCPHKIVQ
ncbi:hypothetical protein BAnh1_04430 [Bartonella australis AUST/NH1]|uniref:Uncharacterized protein n=1 Tax=Bartonella australis (strain Aust/NH1) TaxID=1094489 RepID=M1N330_BARAA|nr:hypothetical protein [Bartonella australis]AGF74324.1 hypothetical protein BAnh1_04430 [Bartonella australis AUST/NH1]